MVWLDSPTIFPFTFLKAPSSLVPQTLSLTKIVESASSLKSSGSISICGSCSKIHFSIIRDFSVFGFLPFCFSNADLPSGPFSDLNANKIFEMPFLSFEINIFLFVLSLSFIVLIIRSTFPFPRWSLTGQMTCSISFSLQNVLNFSLLNAVPGSVRILFGIPFFDMYSTKNSITLSAVGFGKNSASGHPE